MVVRVWEKGVPMVKQMQDCYGKNWLAVLVGQEVSLYSTSETLALQRSSVGPPNTHKRQYVKHFQLEQYPVRPRGRSD